MKLRPQSRFGDNDLADAIRNDAEVLLAVRDSRAFSLELASALASVDFVKVLADGTPSAWKWRCSASGAALLVAEMRAMGEAPGEFLPDLYDCLLLCNTSTAAEDHINRLGWRVW